MEHFSDLFSRFNHYRKRSNLQCPGSFETLHREVKNTLPTLHLIDGAKLDAAAVLGPNFHVTHSLQWGGQEYPPTYHFGANYNTDNYGLSGQLDSKWNLQARAHYNWYLEKALKPDSVKPDGSDVPVSQLPKPSIKTKVDCSLPTVEGHPPMIALEHEHIGQDYSVALKAINPNPFNSPPSYNLKSKNSTITGMYTLSYLQSVSKNLTLGGEFLYQRPTPDQEEPSFNLVGRYIPNPVELPIPSTVPLGSTSPFPLVNPLDPTEIYTASFSPNSGMLHCSYFKKVNQRLDVCCELQSLLTPGIGGSFGRREGIASVGFKLVTVFSQVRGMIDTMGRVSGTADYTLAPGLMFNISGEIDYGKSADGQGRIGLGFQLEA
ncbi:translocase of outer mitochondrial membrane [Clydaea vesicula]|uniref:Translocase of outer mitochondrial membrane n=1 Tax=Clydaea vesicula TaxID=447962 RepID=A0AAD5UC20_9FUNG|nr:translocase of outer mitochondrial membrane [Clydaea vesicula]KAJ3397505.1 translocase of outer mitochondrial membrane [Lobulomyces angularis]